LVSWLPIGISDYYARWIDAEAPWNRNPENDQDRHRLQHSSVTWRCLAPQGGFHAPEAIGIDQQPGNYTTCEIVTVATQSDAIVVTPVSVTPVEDAESPMVHVDADGSDPMVLGA